jgi:hypothetical protein
MILLVLGSSFLKFDRHWVTGRTAVGAAVYLAGLLGKILWATGDFFVTLGPWKLPFEIAVMLPHIPSPKRLREREPFAESGDES